MNWYGKILISKINWTNHFCPFLGDAVRCHQCNSHIDPSCNNKLQTDTDIQDCPSFEKTGRNYTFCRKITQIIEFTVNDCKF